MHASARGPRIVALTASTSADEIALFREAGVDAVFARPIDRDRMRGLLLEQLAAPSSAG